MMLPIESGIPYEVLVTERAKTTIQLPGIDRDRLLYALMADWIKNTPGIGTAMSAGGQIVGTVYQQTV